MRKLLFAAIPLTLSACGTAPSYTYKGFEMNDYFPLDGDRSWTYSQLQEDVTWKLRVDKVPQTVRNGSTEVVTLEYYNDDTGDLLYSVDWSSDGSTGIQVWGYSDELSGDSVAYDPPVQIADRQMLTGDQTVTETDGSTFTSTFQGIEDCENDWRPDWTCAAIDVDDGDGDDTSGPPFAGQWWLATSYGASIFIPTGYSDAWVLASATFE